MTHWPELEKGNELIIDSGALPLHQPHATKLSKLYSGFPSFTPLISKILFLEWDSK